MVKYLQQRPIAVLMAFIAFFIIGIITYTNIPISLLPNIAIPEITIQITGKNLSARELENTMVKPIRQQLMQVSHLRDIKSETRDGSGLVRLYFEYGVNTNLAFIEVNEKIDVVMSTLPREIERPRVVKASASDIPVFYLNLTLKDDQPYAETSETQFLELSELAETVIKRRIEQLPEVAMADMTGIMKKEIRIIPDLSKLHTMGLTLKDIENVLNDNNIEPGSMIVRDGYYEYNIKFSSLLRTSEDVGNIYLRKNERVFQLNDLAEVIVTPQRETGLSLWKGKRAITLAVIKQSDENMNAMKRALAETIDHFQKTHPDIEFTISRNQTELLDYTISNLRQDLLIGFILICIVAILFLNDIKSPFVIALSIVVSLVICFILFYVFHVSLNIISLSGLIMASGMMIDNSIIVVENISQYRAKNFSLENACIKGTNEVISPMLSSSLTTIAVFIPLVFMSGIAGALFFDEAFSVTIGLLLSYLTGIILLPVLYKLIFGLKLTKGNKPQKAPKIHSVYLEHWYHKGIDFIFRRKISTIVFIVVLFPLCIFLFNAIPKERMPKVDQNEMETLIGWNENIHIAENYRRTLALLNHIDSFTVEHTSLLGQTQFLLNRKQELAPSETELYVKTRESQIIPCLQDEISNWLQNNYPHSNVTFQPPTTVFEKIFMTGEAYLVAELYPKNREKAPTAESIYEVQKRLSETSEKPTNIALEEQLNVSIDYEKLLLYNIPYDEVYRLLKTSFKENQTTMLRSFQQYLPIIISGNNYAIAELLQNTFASSMPDEKGHSISVPLSALIKIAPGRDLKTITAGRNGEYIPFSFYDAKDAEKIMIVSREKIESSEEWTIDFSGSWFSNKKMLAELVVILFVSLLLMYFILAAQFESFVQPLILLIEIPIDVAAALLLLWVCGHTLNLMSAIGIVVTCGIVVNDSILKIDLINELRKKGMPIMEAIHEAGTRRLRPILMTSLTTIFAMAPLLFTFDMGSELQKPLAIAMMGAMVVGTLVSLFVLPLIYWLIYRHENQPQKI